MGLVGRFLCFLGVEDFGNFWGFWSFWEDLENLGDLSTCGSKAIRCYKYVWVSVHTDSSFPEKKTPSENGL